MSVKMSDTIDYCCSLKGVFVEHQLAEMIKKVNTDVQELKYEYKSDGFAVTDETVIITFASGFTRSGMYACGYGKPDTACSQENGSHNGDKA